MLDHSAALSAHNVIDGAVVVFRTCVFVFRGRSRDVLAYVKSNGLMWTSQWLHDFIMNFDGQLGDGVTSETANITHCALILGSVKTISPRVSVTKITEICALVCSEHHLASKRN